MLITLLKVPNSYYTQTLLTTKFNEYEKGIGSYPAFVIVPEFEKVVRKLYQQVTLAGLQNLEDGGHQGTAHDTVVGMFKLQGTELGTPATVSLALMGEVRGACKCAYEYALTFSSY